MAGILQWRIFGLSAKLVPTLAVQLLQGATLGLIQIGVATDLRQSVAPEFLSSASGVYSTAVGLIAAPAILASAQLDRASSSYAFLFTAPLCAFGPVAAILIPD